MKRCSWRAKTKNIIRWLQLHFKSRWKRRREGEELWGEELKGESRPQNAMKSQQSVFSFFFFFLALCGFAPLFVVKKKKGICRCPRGIVSRLLRCDWSWVASPHAWSEVKWLVNTGMPMREGKGSELSVHLWRGCTAPSRKRHSGAFWSAQRTVCDLLFITSDFKLSC